MIEVIYKDESQEGQNGEEPFGLPRNIRQIGLAAEDYRIYMEDYVYTFLVRLARTEDSLGEAKTRVAVLTGNLKWRSQTAYLFIKGAIIAEEMEAAPDHIDFSENQWNLRKGKMLSSVMKTMKWCVWEGIIFIMKKIPVCRRI